MEYAIQFKLTSKEYAARNANYEWLPSDLDWEKVEKISKFLSIFNNVSMLFSSITNSTLNLYLVEAWRAKQVFDKYHVCEYDFMQNMAKSNSCKI